MFPGDKAVYAVYGCGFRPQCCVFCLSGTLLYANIVYTLSTRVLWSMLTQTDRYEVRKLAMPPV